MKKLSVYDLTQNPFSLIGKSWAMITTRDGDKTNTMTASWGGVGIMWGKPAAFIFIRPQRFTRELIDVSGNFSICFFPESQREKLSYCGSHSGRDGDKLAHCGFTASTLDDAPVLDQAELVLTCKKLYRQQLDGEFFCVPGIDAQYYADHDYHYMYVAEILSAYEK